MIMLHSFYLPPLVAGIALFYIGSKILYNVFFHPLREYPGPFLSKATRMVWSYNTFNGNLIHYVTKLHETYGEIVRISPNELSYISEQAWTDIYGHRTPDGHGNLPKDLRLRRKDINGIPSILFAEGETHRRFRRLQAHMFSANALNAQEPLITGYVDLLISRLQGKAKSSETCVVNIVQWFNYTTFDILGSLAFGASFGCLDSDVLHPWVANIWPSVKEATYARVSKQFPWPLERLVYAMSPRGLEKARREEFSFASQKARERISQGETGRADFMSYILKYNDEKGMTTGEIESNASLLIIAGSETTATLLSGITYYLLRNPEVLKRTTDLIRTTFTVESNINILNLQQVEYFTACIEEGLRTFPPVPGGLPRRTTAGGNVICGSYTSQHNFTDPYKFDPERWLKNPPAKYANDKMKVFQPFSFGPRNCIGRNLAYAEIRLVLARVLWNFDFELQPECRNWADQKTYGLWEKTPLNVKLIPRKATKMQLSG